jgi:spermidine synthase
LATSPDSKVRDPARAVELAEKASSLDKSQNPAALDTLAAAYAAAGKFAQACQTAHLALEQAAASGNTPLVEEINTKLQLYKNEQPYYDYAPPVKTNGNS